MKNEITESVSSGVLRGLKEYWRRLVNVARALQSLKPALVAADGPDSVIRFWIIVSAGLHKLPTAKTRQVHSTLSAAGKVGFGAAEDDLVHCRAAAFDIKH
jgi:hypothetical protein